MAKASSRSYTYFSKSSKELAKTASVAKRLGVTMDQIASIT